MRTAAATRRSTWTRRSPMLRDAYGRNLFGQGCLLARRLVERGVPFVEVTLAGVGGNNVFGWDTHQQNFEAVQAAQRACSIRPGRTLMEDLQAARPARFDADRVDGRVRPHAADQSAAGPRSLPNAWTTVLAGGGIKGGQAFGKTSADGTHGRGAAASASAISWPPFASPWASIRPSRTSPTSAGPSASPTRAPSRSRRCCHDSSVTA